MAKLVRVRWILEFDGGRPVEVDSVEAPKGSGLSITFRTEGPSVFVRSGERDGRGLGPGERLVTIRLESGMDSVRVSDEEIIRMGRESVA